MATTYRHFHRMGTIVTVSEANSYHPDTANQYPDTRTIYLCHQRTITPYHKQTGSGIFPEWVRSRVLGGNRSLTRQHVFIKTRTMILYLY